MPSTPRGAMAAPNQCEIKAKVTKVERSLKFADKWNLDLEILESKDVSGPNFARAGESAKGFTFESISDLSPNSVLTARAEFLGDQGGGQFQLSRIMILDSK